MVAPANQAPLIDNLEFAQKALETHGIIAVSQFSRIADQLQDDDGELSWSLRGDRDPDGALWLQLRVEGTLQLRCQRCLQPLAHPLAIDVRYRLVRDEAALPAPEDDLDDEDYLLFQQEMSVPELVEEEVLLALPMAPRHEDGRCGDADEIMKRYRPAGPFADLAEALGRKK